jgi:hypothetical protein
MRQWQLPPATNNSLTISMQSSIVKLGLLNTRVNREAYNLGDDKRSAQPIPGALCEWPAARPCHEDEGLPNDAHLQVQGRHHLILVATQRSHVERSLLVVQQQEDFN